MRVVPPSIRNAVARALIADVTLKALPKSRAEQTTRQTLMTQTVARSLGVSFEAVKPAMIIAWAKVYGMPYAFPQQQDRQQERAA